MLRKLIFAAYAHDCIETLSIYTMHFFLQSFQKKLKALINYFFANRADGCEMILIDHNNDVR